MSTHATIVASAFLTRDGVMQGPGGPTEDRQHGFTWGGWSVPHWDERMGEIVDGHFEDADALLLGRRTYDIFADHWPDVEDDGDPTAAKINRMPKFVASRTRRSVDWKNTALLDGPVPAAIDRLRRERSGSIMTQGSADLLQTLLANELVDAFLLWVFPVVLGSGTRLFGDGTVPTGLTLSSAETTSSGVQVCRYEREGTPEVGSFA